MKQQRKAGKDEARGTPELPAPVAATAPQKREVAKTATAEKAGIFRFSLLLLIAVVLVINAPYLGGHYFPEHDTRFILGLFDFFYGNFLFNGNFAHWMVYGLYGMDASPFYVSFISPSNFLGMFLGRLFDAYDSLNLYLISVCFEQLLLLLGFYLLCRRLFKSRMTIFCLSLTVVCTSFWQTQLFINFRVCALLPLLFYFIVRLKQDGKGCFGWLAGVVAIFGPMGAGAYWYPFWAFMVAIFSVSLFWGEFRGLTRAMTKLEPSNIMAFAAFALLAAIFAGSLHGALVNFDYVSPDRTASGGGVKLESFLTYGGTALSDMMQLWLLPSANVDTSDGRMGMNDYLGLVSLIGLPFAVRQLKSREARSFAILLVCGFIFSRGGIFATVAYFFPGLHLMRHIAFILAILKLYVLILAGYGLEALPEIIRSRKLAPYMTRTTLFAAVLAIVMYFDLYIGGPSWAQFCTAVSSGAQGLFSALAAGPIYPLLRALMLLGLVLAIWQSCKPANLADAQSARLAIFAVMACVVGDCFLFQAETRGLLHFEEQKIAFPALKPQFVFERADKLPAAAVGKYQIWQKGRGSDYEANFAAAMQWEPLVPRMRIDWFPSNALSVLKIMSKTDTNEIQTVCGQRVRVVSSAVHVGSDEEALSLLDSKTGWNDRVILTDPANSGKMENGPSAAGSRFDLVNFTANSLELNISNSSGSPAWFVFADAHTPGWHATVNGESEPILTAYGAFKAVNIGPGTSQVRMDYDTGLPDTFMNVLIALSALAVAIGLAGLAWVGIKEAMTG